MEGRFGGGRPSFAGAGAAGRPVRRRAEPGVASADRAGQRGQVIAEDSRRSPRSSYPRGPARCGGQCSSKVTLGQWLVVDDVVDPARDAQGSDYRSAGVGEVDRRLVTVGVAEGEDQVVAGLAQHLLAVGGSGTVEPPEAQDHPGSSSVLE